MRASLGLAFLFASLAVACGDETDVATVDATEEAALSEYGRPSGDDTECRDTNPGTLEARCGTNDDGDDGDGDGGRDDGREEPTALR